jgi:hypothetical protein
LSQIDRRHQAQRDGHGHGNDRADENGAPEQRQGPECADLLARSRRLRRPDGSKKEHENGTTALQMIQKDIGEGLLRAAIAAKFNNKLQDLTTPITTSGTLTILTFIPHLFMI